jgi:hypothetical protein
LDFPRAWGLLLGPWPHWVPPISQFSVSPPSGTSAETRKNGSQPRGRGSVWGLRFPLSSQARDNLSQSPGGPTPVLCGPTAFLDWPIRKIGQSEASIWRKIHNPLFEVRGGGVLDDLSRGALLLAAPSLLRLTRSLSAPHPPALRRLHCTRLTPAMDLDTLS